MDCLSISLHEEDLLGVELLRCLLVVIDKDGSETAKGERKVLSGRRVGGALSALLCLVILDAS